MKKRNIILYICLSLVAFPGIIELFHPAPKMTDYCSKPTCRMEAISRLEGTSEDYRGGLIPFFIGCFLIALVIVIIALITPYPRQLMTLGTMLMVDSVFYTVMMRFVSPFSRWPVQTWIVVVTVVFLSLMFLTIPIILKRQVSVG